MRLSKYLLRDISQHYLSDKAGEIDWDSLSEYIDYDDIIRRISALETIKRYNTLPMVHRTNDFLHMIRTDWIANYICLVMNDRNYDIKFDWAKICDLAGIHDDTEIYTGDIPMPEKSNATDEEKWYIKKEEKDAATKLVLFYPYILPVDKYRELLDEIREKNTTESHIVDVADKLDALGETIHEIRSGNEVFLTVLEDYKQVFDEFLQKYDWWQHLSHERYFQLNEVPTPEQAKSIPLLKEEQCYSREGIEEIFNQRSAVPWYDRWIWLTFLRSEYNIAFCNDPIRILMPEWADRIFKNWKLEEYGWQETKSGLLIPRRHEKQ